MSTVHTLAERRVFYRKTDVKAPVTNIDFLNHTLTDVEVDGRELLVQTSVEWAGTKEDKTLLLRTQTRNTRCVFFGTASPISITNIGNHQQDPEKSRRTFYRKNPAEVERNSGTWIPSLRTLRWMWGLPP